MFRYILWKIRGPEVDEIYSKGEFADLAFITFASACDRDRASEMIRDNKEDVPNVWAKQDLPTKKRACCALLLGIQWHLEQWKFKNVNVDDALTHLTVGDQEIFKSGG